ncbi:hypothetical protein P4S72_15335 [Vibrio sp. PP-XX7]
MPDDPIMYSPEKNNKGIYGLERIYEDRAVLTPFFDVHLIVATVLRKQEHLVVTMKKPLL